MMLADLSNPTIVGGAIAGAVALVTAIFGFRRGRAADAITDQTREDTTSAKGVDQVISGLNDLVKLYREESDRTRARLEAVLADNAALKDAVRELDVKLTRALSEIEDLKTQLNPKGGK